MSIQNVAVITGAGRGMGAAIARNLAGRGWAVSLLSPSGAAESLSQELGGIGVTGTVPEEGDLRQLIDRTMDAYGRIDGVVNSTGHIRPRAISWIYRTRTGTRGWISSF